MFGRVKQRNAPVRNGRTIVFRCSRKSSVRLASQERRDFELVVIALPRSRGLPTMLIGRGDVARRRVALRPFAVICVNRGGRQLILAVAVARMLRWGHVRDALGSRDALPRGRHRLLGWCRLLVLPAHAKGREAFEQGPPL